MSQHKLTHPQLVEFLRQQIDIAAVKSIAVLIIALRRTDRLEAITGNISSQTIMQHVDQRLATLLRNADRYAQFDTGQLLLVLPNLANKDHSVLAAIKIISELKRTFVVDAHSVALRPHIGIANFPEVTRESKQLLMFADIASGIAATNEHGFYVYQTEDYIEPKAYNGLDVALDNAIKTNELRVNFQPKIDIKTGRCVSAESLIRWTAPWGQEVNPGLLVATAEDCGLINPLTLWILNTALRHASVFSKAGIDIGISVNLPPKMLEEDELPQIVQQTLDIWDVPASRLTLEITEGSMINNAESSLAMLGKLRALGISLSIDDFGTGYSSLAYLKRLPVQELKIDILFVRNIHNSKGDKQLVRTIIDLAHNFDLTTVAEGVEDQATLDLLRELGCDEVQGFIFSRALPEAEFIKWYRQHN